MNVLLEYDSARYASCSASHGEMESQEVQCKAQVLKLLAVQGGWLVLAQIVQITDPPRITERTNFVGIQNYRIAGLEAM